MKKIIISFFVMALVLGVQSYALSSTKTELTNDVTTINGPIPGDNIDTSGESQFLQKLEDVTADVPPSDEFLEIEGLITYDVPVVVNDRVNFFINYFQTRGRKYFERWLARSNKYLPMIKKTLRENDMPEDLAYLALIESGFNPNAYSRAKAVGMWQFIKGTGLRYGLKINPWIDERRDPEKATMAAANYLKDLYAMFNSWDLAAASYNAGEGKITRAIDKHNTVDFWVMAKKKYLKQETKDYVPKFIAALLIAKEPEKYGFYNIEPESPIEYESAAAPGATDLRAIAKASNSTLEEIKELNPELLRSFTPPNIKEYEIKIPLGSKDKFYENLAQMPQQEKRNFLTHKVKKGETILKIAKMYSTGVEPITYLNSRNQIKPGAEIIIPVMANANHNKEESGPKMAKKELKRLAKNEAREISREINYIVKKGDTTAGIAEKFGTTVEAIKKWNDMDNAAKIFPGDKIRIYPRIARLDLQKDTTAR
ncbi:MAG: transglycosylase SLT domain-containing protein [Deltaproteobacteria bacterium]|nr:transglycosylase SLT domain-containing protein [Deltaproteobacteria bacterium]